MTIEIEEITITPQITTLHLLEHRTRNLENCLSPRVLGKGFDLDHGKDRLPSNEEVLVHDPGIEHDLLGSTKLTRLVSLSSLTNSIKLWVPGPNAIASHEERSQLPLS